jgi:hypothetical protein
VEPPLTKKILMGKRSFLSNDIMSESLLSSDFDILFYNTKIDTIKHCYKNSILAGNDFSLFELLIYKVKGFWNNTIITIIRFYSMSGDVNLADLQSF